MTAHDTVPARRALGALAALATLPYVTMKLAWLAGHPVGVTQPGLLDSPGMPVMNAVTVLLDVCVIALAVALASRRTRRLPAVVVLLPGWVATGLLTPIALVSLPLTLAVPPGAEGGMESWVRPMVYGGFTVQGLCLLASFALYARDRWGDRVAAPGPVPDAVRPLLRACTAGGAVTGVLAALLQTLGGLGTGPVGWVAAVVPAVLILAGVVASLRLETGRGGPAVVVAWVGSAVAFAGGLYGVGVTMGSTQLSMGGSPAAGIGLLAGLLSGFALAVAGLLALSGAVAGAPRPSWADGSLAASGGPRPGAGSPAAAPYDAGSSGSRVRHTASRVGRPVADFM